ncbi:aldehyde dehydrogenase family 3 member I1, chloroplastic-like isoform X2 [Gossypium arboreum]|uniref:aldehyde dehydrogenase family 3 member I1, chloroplastic-like isoform X2 n=1 Tax=Gossypium arboreum TaxID=29729 RepID=UPI0022F1A4C5|nr:aldehyde dehydrogenase family 3 member I1, chloroplastic-like isoform X2 [Gossypium arboreum]
MTIVSPGLFKHPSRSYSIVGVGLLGTFTYRHKYKINRVSFSSSTPSYYCRATLSTTMEEVKPAFDSDKAAVLVNELRKTFNSGKTKSYEWRISQLESISKMIDEKEKEIVEALQKDLSKPELEAFLSEILMARSSCKLALKELKQWMMPQKVETSLATYPSSAEIVAEPLGVVLVISTWNFPFSLSLDPVIGAIAAGNAVVLKPSEIAPATSSLLSRLVGEYMDKSAIIVVEGAVAETSALLEQKWDKIFFTGGARVGRIVMAAAAKNLTPVTLELGGKCPAVVDSNVNLQVTARRIVAGKWVCNNGQACIGVDYIITTKELAPKLIATLVNVVEEIFGKDLMESKERSRIINSFHFKRLVNLLEEDKVSNKIVFGGQRDESQLQIAPTILLDVPEDSMIMQEEIFGPLLPIITVERLEDSFAMINRKPKPLAAYLFSDDEQIKRKFVQNIYAGGMAINDTILQVTVPTLPFGGVGESGMGSYHGKFSFDAFSHKKAVLYRSFAGDSPTRYPPYTPGKKKQIKALLSGKLLNIMLALLGFYKD